MSEEVSLLKYRDETSAIQYVGPYTDPPNTVDSVPHPSFSLDDTERSDRPIWVSTLSDATIIAGRYVVSKKGNIIVDVIEGRRRKQLISRIIEKEAPKTLFHTCLVDGVVAMVGSRWASGYFHWITDVLPRIRLIQECFDIADDVDFYAFPEGVPSAGLEAIKELGIEESQLLQVEPRERLKVDQLILPSLPGKTGRPPKWALSFLRQRLLTQGRNSNREWPKRLYLARQGKRTVENREEVLPVLLQNGFHVVYPEQYSFAEQISLFSHAEAVVGPHGSGFTNTIFCSPKTKLLELFSARYVNPCYFHIAQHLDPYNGDNMIPSPEKIKNWIRNLKPQ